MNPLTKVLRTLRHTSTAWSIIICPNPRTDLGTLPKDRPGTYEYRLNLHSGIYLDQFLRDFPMCAGASNITSHIPPEHIRKYHIFPALVTQIFSCSSESKVVRILYQNMKNEKGKTVSQVLVDILEKFPTYDLEMKEDTEAAICDMEKKLIGIADIASFEEVGDAKNPAKKSMTV